MYLGFSHRTRQTDARSQQAYSGDAQACPSHDDDLVSDLCVRLDAIWRYDTLIARAGDRTDLTACWKDFKRQEIESIARIRALINSESDSYIEESAAARE